MILFVMKTTSDEYKTPAFEGLVFFCVYLYNGTYPFILEEVNIYATTDF